MSKSFTSQTSIFEDETVLYDDWTPDELPEREQELDHLHDALAPVTRGAAPHNTFVFGKTGQGKTAGVDHKLRDLEAFADEYNDDADSESDELEITIINYSCAKDNTSYQVACNLVEELCGEKPWGYDKKTVFDRLYDELQNIGGTVIIVLDEIDSIGTDDDILYEIPRARANGHVEDMWVSIIGISNDFEFRDNLSPKVKDTLCDEEIHFPPYTAEQLQSILERRAKKAFKHGVLDNEVLPLCAAFAAQDKGSARQAIRYLYKAGELASNRNLDRVTEEHVREAEELIERKSLEKGVRDLTTQDHLALVAVVSLAAKGETPTRTRHVYAEYTNIAHSIDADTIEMRRVRDHLQELDLIGIVEGRKKRTGIQGGPHWIWKLDADLGMTIEILEGVSRFSEVMEMITS